MARQATTDPVAVLGNGPVGQTTALLLARWGVPSILIDQRPRRDPIGSKSICQQRDVLDIWSACGAEAIADEGLTWTTARTFYRGQELFALQVPDSGRSPLPPFVNLSQTRTEELLDERIAAEPRIDVRWNHTVTEVRQDAAAVHVTCDTPAGTVRLRTPYAVACCGAHTELRRLLGVEFQGRSFDDRFLICDIRAELPGWAQERRFYFDPEWNPGRQVLIHPCPDSTFRIDWQVPADYDLEAEEADGRLDARIRQVIGDRDYEIVWHSVYRFHSRVADRMRAGRVLLAGDCAHLFAPFGARGLNSGVADAENAAWKLAAVLRGWAPDDLLESYHAERHAAALENLDVTSETMRFLVPHGEEERTRRLSVLDRARHDPDAHAEVDSGRLSEPFWYVDSPLTTPDPARPFAGRPPRGSVPDPAPGVLAPDAPIRVDGAATRLREAARRGPLILVADAAQAAGTAAAARRAVAAPVRVLALAEADPDGALARTLGVAPGEFWVLRPDAYIAAVVHTRDHAVQALRCALGTGTSAQAQAIPRQNRQKEADDGVLPTGG